MKELSAKSSLALVRRAIRDQEQDQKLKSAIREVGQLSDKAYICLISDLSDYATLWRPDVRTSISALILTALRKNKKISVSTLLSWCYLLSKWRLHREVEESLEILRRRNIEIPPKEIVKLAQAAIDSWEFKLGMLIVSQGKCNYERYLPLYTLCHWVRRSTYSYDGNHGAHRLCALVCMRTRHLRIGSQKYKDALETIAQALCDVSREEIVFEAILKGSKQRLRPFAFQEMTKRLKELLAAKMLEVEKASKTRFKFIETISQEPIAT